MTNRNFILSVFIVIACVFLFFVSLKLLLVFPPIWPDEALFSNPALNLVMGNGMGTTVLTGLLPGIETHTYWQPPVYFLLLSIIYKLFGFSIFVTRFFSFIVGGLCLGITYLLAYRFMRDKFFALLVIFWLIVDAIFIRASHIGRMDIFAVFFSLLGLYLFIKAWDSGKNKAAYFFSGLAICLAIFTHYLAFFIFLAILTFWFLQEGTKIFKNKYFYFFIAPLLVALLLYGGYIQQDFASFCLQMSSQIYRKTIRITPLIGLAWGLTSTMHLPEVAATFLVLYVYAFIATYIQGFLRKNPDYYLGRLLFLSLFFVFIFASLLGKEIWYTIYGLPFVYLSVFWSIKMALSENRKKGLWFIYVCLIAVLFINLNYVINQLINTRQQDYGKFSSKLIEKIKPNATVFIACIPDPYFILASQRPDLQVREFNPTVANEKNDFLDKVDVFITGQVSDRRINYKGWHDYIQGFGYAAHIYYNK